MVKVGVGRETYSRFAPLDVGRKKQLRPSVSERPTFVRKEKGRREPQKKVYSMIMNSKGEDFGHIPLPDAAHSCARRGGSDGSAVEGGDVSPGGKCIVYDER
jgi:hypothetical protein